MDLQAEELQFLSMAGIVKEAISIPNRSPRTFSLLTLALILPLSIATFAHALFTRPILTRLHSSDALLFVFLLQLLYILFLFSFSLLSTAAVVFTAASIYTGKSVSFSATIAAIPAVLRPLLRTFLWAAVFLLLDHLLFLLILLPLRPLRLQPTAAFLVALAVFLPVHVYVTALWHLASVVSVLEPQVYGLAAMKKSYQLLKGKVCMAGGFVLAYLSICGVVNWAFNYFAADGDHGEFALVRVDVGAFLVMLLVFVNLLGLLVQSVFYYVCKSFHHEGIDKTALNHHLGGYLGEYLPLTSSIQLENLDI